MDWTLLFYLFPPHFLWVLKLMNAAGGNSDAFILNLYSPLPTSSCPEEVKCEFWELQFMHFQAGTIPVSFTMRGQKGFGDSEGLCACEYKWLSE